MPTDRVLVINRCRGFWTVAEGAEDAARFVGWVEDAPRYEARAFVPIHASKISPLIMKALTFGVTIRPILLDPDR